MVIQNRHTNWDRALLLITLLPLFLVNMNNYHDWGDDFAQYLMQAKFITGENSSDLVSQLHNYSPERKGLLFSAFLIPATWSELNEIFYSKILITISFILVGFFLFTLIKNKTDLLASLLFSIFFIYNYHLLHFKDQILPDFAFLSIVLGVAILTDKIEISSNIYFKKALLLSIVSVGFRSAGVVVILALIASHYLRVNKTENLISKKSINHLLIISLTFVVLIFLASLLNFDNGMLSWYINLINHHSTGSGIAVNLEVYSEWFRLFFEQELPFWLNILFKWFLFPAMATGFILRILKKWRFLEFFVILYIILILIYPYNNEPVRFLLPLLACGIIYTVEGYQFLLSTLMRKYQKILMIIIGLLLCICNIKSTSLAYSGIVEYEPYSESSKGLFQFIETEIPKDEKIAFSKPWAVAYFTNHKTVPYSAYKNAHWIIHSKNMNNPEFSADPILYTTTFKNSEFIVYRRK